MPSVNAHLGYTHDDRSHASALLEPPARRHLPELCRIVPGSSGLADQQAIVPSVQRGLGRKTAERMTDVICLGKHWGQGAEAVIETPARCQPPVMILSRVIGSSRTRTPVA